MKILFRSRDISYKVLRPFKKITYFRVSRPCILEVRGDTSYEVSDKKVLSNKTDKQVDVNTNPCFLVCDKKRIIRKDANPCWYTLIKQGNA